jgi:hypothetical protein
MGVGSSYLMDFPLTIPAYCRGSGKRNWEKAEKGLLLQREHHGLNSMNRRSAPRDCRPLTGHDPNAPVGSGRYRVTQSLIGLLSRDYHVRRMRIFQLEMST